MRHPTQANPKCCDAGSPVSQAVRYRTVFVDWAKAGPALCQRAADRPRSTPARRSVTTVDRELELVRANVQDAARAVLAWLAHAVGHQGKQGLDEVLDRCLRPGPDSLAVNFNALTEQINLTLGTELTPKRVRTAVRHLRAVRQRKAESAATPRVDTLDRSLALRERLIEAGPRAGADDEALVLDLLGAVRAAAGRLIDCDFGEGIPGGLDRAQLVARFGTGGRRVTRRGAWDRLLRTLRDCDGEGEADMRLVLDGAQVVSDLAGARSLPTVIARLNVLVAGRDLLSTEVYTGRLLDLADEAEALRDDPSTVALLGRVRRMPAQRRMPSPVRVSSYCLNNTATHLLDRLLDGRVGGDEPMAVATGCVQRMIACDPGFALLRVTRLIHAVVATRLGGDPSAVETLVGGWGEDATLAVLEDLARFDNNPLMLDTVDHHVRGVFPSLRGRVIRAA